MVMPDLGGGTTFDRLKEINKDVKVLLSSGYSLNGQATEIMNKGCAGFIQKPFDLKKLSQKVKEIIN
jgi:two-component system cell cycle sensor histidine kinase/response regulator CckA